jgi:hypothetical protein
MPKANPATTIGAAAGVNPYPNQVAPNRVIVGQQPPEPPWRTQASWTGGFHMPWSTQPMGGAPPTAPMGLTPPMDLGGRSRIPGMDVQQQHTGDQLEFLSQLLAGGALGMGPSAAQPMLQSAMEQGMRQQLAAAAAGGPSGYAAGLRGAQLAAPQAQAQFGRDAAALRAQEQQEAQKLLMQNLLGTRASDTAYGQLVTGTLDTGAGRDLESILRTAGVGQDWAQNELTRAQVLAQIDKNQQDAIQAAYDAYSKGLIDVAQMNAQIDIANDEAKAAHAAAQTSMITGGIGGGLTVAPKAPGGAAGGVFTGAANAGKPNPK